MINRPVIKHKGKGRVNDSLEFLAKLVGRTINLGRRDIQVSREDDEIDLGLAELEITGTELHRTIQNVTGNTD